MRIDYVYKICTKKEWNFFKEKKTWHGSNKDIEDGFIHLSDREQVNQTLKKYFSNSIVVKIRFCSVLPPSIIISFNTLDISIMSLEPAIRTENGIRFDPIDLNIYICSLFGL